MQITFKNAHKLRAGNTVWRCMTHGDGYVYVEETLLAGSKTTKTSRSIFPAEGKKPHVLFTALHIGPKDREFSGNYLNDIHGAGCKWIAAFTTRREALRWKQQVEAGYNEAALVAWKEHKAEMDSWDDLSDAARDYYDGYYDDGPYNGLAEDDSDMQHYIEEAIDATFALEAV